MLLKRCLANVVIAAFLLLAFIDSYPGAGAAWKRLQAAVDPILDATGLWQERWDLFAPNVDRQNHHLEIIARYSDGETISWRSPDWRQYSCPAMFVSIREVEFFDRVRQPGNFQAWPSFADYARRTLIPASTSGASVAEIHLMEHNRPLADLRLPPRTTPETSSRVFHRQTFEP
jgi:hypothetical protein